MRLRIVVAVATRLLHVNAAEACWARVRGTTSLGHAEMWTEAKPHVCVQFSWTCDVPAQSTSNAKASDEILEVNKAARTCRDVTAELMAEVQERAAARIEKPRRIEHAYGALLGYRGVYRGNGKQLNASD